jgi:hypothetical protein
MKQNETAINNDADSIIKPVRRDLMTRKIAITIMTTLVILVLVACGGDSQPSADSEPSADADAANQPVNQIVDQVETSSSDKAQLSDDYSDSLTIEGQLALGTIKLDDTSLAVSEEQAAELLILWQAYQSLNNSDIAASAEVMAVLNQIQDTMTAGQIAAISEMKLTADSMTALIEEGELVFGRGGFGSRGGDGGDGGGFPGGAFPGGIPGQRPGGGPGGGLPGGGFGNISEDDIATRQAQFQEGDFGGFRERILTGAVIGLLQNKTGEIPEPEGIFATIFSVVGEEIDLSVEELQSQTADGLTLVQIIENNGGDIEAIQSMLKEELSNSEQFRGRDMEAFIGNLFGLGS